MKYKNKLIGWREFIMNNIGVHRYFRVETKGLCELYTISGEKLQEMLK